MSGRAKRSKVFQSSIEYLCERFAALPDYRVGDNKFIKMRDVGLSAFSVFFTQCASFLEHQASMQRRMGKNNAKTLFGIEHIPSDNYIRKLLDPILPSDIFPVYDYALNQIQQAGLLDEWRVLDNQLLLAVDGLCYFSSKEISCARCSHQHHKDGKITHTHSMMAATIVRPGCAEVLPVCPEFIEPQDGHDKEDCERVAIKRWLLTQGPRYSKLGVTLLGDDLYCCQPICEAVLNAGFHFIFTCKPDSHKCLYEWIDSLDKSNKLSVVEEKMKEKGKPYTYRCRYINKVPLKDDKKSLEVNWLSVEVFDKQGKLAYSSAFATDHELTHKNVVMVAQAGRTRWKIENEHNNTLKNQGYHLAHNYGHGKQHLASVLATLILLSFLFHTMLKLLDARYRAIREDLPYYMFWNQFKTLLFYMHFANWDALMEFMLQGCELTANTS